MLEVEGAATVEFCWQPLPPVRGETGWRVQASRRGGRRGGHVYMWEGDSIPWPRLFVSVDEIWGWIGAYLATLLAASRLARTGRMVCMRGGWTELPNG